MRPQSTYTLAGFLVIYAAVLAVWAFAGPSNAIICLGELLPGLLGILLLCSICRRYRFSNLVYGLVVIHFFILAAGARYNYYQMPLFNWLRDLLGLQRNYYDRVGHLAQGFIPAIIARETLIRWTPLKRGKMVVFLAVCVCLAFSALWELVEWWTVILFVPGGGPEWLGAQGDPWDAHQDMLMAILGAIAALALLSRWNDRSIEKLEARNIDS